MHAKLTRTKGVSASAVRLLERAESRGFVASPTSSGPAKFLRNLQPKRKAIK